MLSAGFKLPKKNILISIGGLPRKVRVLSLGAVVHDP